MFNTKIKHIKNEVIGVVDDHHVGTQAPPIKPSRLSNSGIPVFVIQDQNQELFLCPVCNIEILKSNLNWHIQTMHQVEVYNMDKNSGLFGYNEDQEEDQDLKPYIAGKDFKFNKTRPPAMMGGYMVSSQHLSQKSAKFRESSKGQG